jgi:hypothetical protein
MIRAIMASDIDGRFLKLRSPVKVCMSGCSKRLTRTLVELAAHSDELARAWDKYLTEISKLEPLFYHVLEKKLLQASMRSQSAQHSPTVVLSRTGGIARRC